MYTRKLFRVYTNIDLCIHMFVMYTNLCTYTSLCVYTFMICVYTQPYMCIHMFVIYTNSCIHKFLCIHIYDLCIHTSTSCVHDFSSRHLEVSVCGLLRWSLHVYWPRKIRDGCPSWMLRCSLARTATPIRQFSTARQLWQGWRCSSPLPLTKREPAPKVHRCSIDSPHHYLFSCVAG